MSLLLYTYSLFLERCIIMTKIVFFWTFSQSNVSIFSNQTVATIVLVILLRTNTAYSDSTTQCVQYVSYIHGYNRNSPARADHVTISGQVVHDE